MPAQSTTNDPSAPSTLPRPWKRPSNHTAKTSLTPLTADRKRQRSSHSSGAGAAAADPAYEVQPFYNSGPYPMMTFVCLRVAGTSSSCRARASSASRGIRRNRAGQRDG